jgi:hypothetical protein
MPMCLHHVQWVRPIPGGLHRCIICGEIVGWKDVYPKPEDLTEDFRARWKAHEATREASIRSAASEPTTP